MLNPDSNQRGRMLLLVIPLVLLMATGTALGQTTTFTYQGRLTDGGTPANGSYDIQFKLFEAVGGSGLPIGSTITQSAVAVSGGIFTVQLDFGASAFPGADRFLEIATRQHSADPDTPAYTTLSPRQQLTSTPYAVRSGNATLADAANDASHLGGVAADQYVQINETQNVNVVNTPTVNAQQSGTWNVGINGTPSVNVANMPTVGIDPASNVVQIGNSGPVPVRDVDNPARQPFQTTASVSIEDGDSAGTRDLTTVPAGKVLVLEQVSVDARLAGQKLVSVVISSQGVFFLPPHYLMQHDEGTDVLGRNVFIASQHVRLYFTEGVKVRCHAERNGTAGQASVLFSVSGYFVDKP